MNNHPPPRRIRDVPSVTGGFFKPLHVRKRTHIAHKRQAIRESPLRKILKFCGRGWRPRHPEKTNDYSAQKRAIRESPLQPNFNIHRRGDHRSPAFVRDMPSFSGAPRRSPTGWDFVCGNLFVFRDVEGAIPYRKIV